MKCEQARMDILLEHAGELGSWRRSGLARHMEGCSACRQYRDDLAQIATATRMVEQPTVDRLAMQMLLNEAQRMLDRKAVPAVESRLWKVFQTLENPLPALRPALAVAAVALLLAGGVWLVRLHSGVAMAWNDGVDQQIDRLEASLASLSQDADGNRTSNADAETIASQLLEVEG